MRRILLMKAFVLLSALSAHGVAAQPEPTLQLLDWLIGSWEFEDVEIEGEYRETGSRVCEYALDDYYILCESSGTSHTGRQRTYRWYVNYNTTDQRFEITGLFAGFPRKILHVAEVSDGGHRLELEYGAWEGDGIVFDGRATVIYNGTDQYVWETASFRDVVTRRPDP